MRTLSTRALNRALLARQNLLDRAARSIPSMVEGMAGIQAQYAPSIYIGLWTRLTRLARSDVTQALESRSIVQGTLLRSTIHVVSARDYWPIALAIRQPRRDWFLRVSREVTADELEVAAGRLREAVAGRSLSARDIDTLLGRRYRTGVGLWLDLVRVPPAGTWEHRRADRYALAEEWVGPPAGNPDDGVDLLVRRYLAAFGPATQAQIADWAGLPVRSVAAAVQRLSLRTFRSEDGATLLDLPRAPLPDPETAAPVRFLPTFDATLLVHARRTQILPEAHRPKVFHVRMPQSVGTFLVDGAVAGTWRYDRGRVHVTEFDPLPRHVRGELAAEADRLAAFHG